MRDRSAVVASSCRCDPEDPFCSPVFLGWSLSVANRLVMTVLPRGSGLIRCFVPDGSGDLVFGVIYGTSVPAFHSSCFVLNFNFFFHRQ